MPRRQPPPDHVRVAIAALIRARRIAAGLTQIELANQVGVHPNTVGQWDTGMRAPETLETWMRVARAVGVPLSMMLSPLDTVRLPELPEDTKVFDARTRSRKPAPPATPQDARGGKETPPGGDGDG